MDCGEIYKKALGFIHRSMDGFDAFAASMKVNPQCINALDYSGTITILHNAAQYNHLELIKLLLDLGAKVDIPAGDSHETPLHRAMIGEAFEAAEILLNSGANPNALNTSLQSPIFYLGGHIDPVKTPQIASLLLKHGADVHLRDWKGDAPLHGICIPEMAQLLLQYGAEVDAQNNAGETPLIESASHGVDKMVQFFLKNGANINLKNENGRTMLHLFVFDDEYGNTPQVRKMLSLGAEINARDNEGFSPLYQASAAHYLPGVKLLISKGADVNLRDNEGRTPLYAVENDLYLGINHHYVPPPQGDGNPLAFAKMKKKIAGLLREAGGTL